MPTAAFGTLGCKVNQYETQRILDSFEERGFDIAGLDQPADVYVVNSCSVTHVAERKSRQMVRKLQRQNPDAVVVMTGCAGEMLRIKGEALEEASLMVPNAEKLRTLDRLLTAYPRFEAQLANSPAPVRIEEAPGRRTRATIKVQDGCNVKCSFCSIPYTRSVMASRPIAEVLDEVVRLVDRGYREFVVTGVLVGWYGTDLGDVDLAELLRRMARIPGVERVRLSSVEPTQVTESLLSAFADEPRLCPHLHIPLQSGDTQVLARMNRPYDQDFYLRLAERAFERIPNLAITSDIMVGFPGEDRAAFEQTVHVAREVGFARAHIFRFSPRPGTPAETMTDVVSDGDKEGRAKELADVCRQTQQKYIARYLGSSMPVLVEGKDREGGLLSGYTPNYIRVVFTGGSHMVGRVENVRLVEPTTDGAVAEIANSFQPEADEIPISLVVGAVR
jgi:threonylcarbamoyladenosine tRNA methylthiotransferase MtaB